MFGHADPNFGNNLFGGGNANPFVNNFGGFGNNNNGFNGFSGFNNVESFIINAVNNQLIMLVRSNTINQQIGSMIMQQVKKNIQIFANELARATNNFQQNTDNQSLTNFIGQVIQFIMNDLQQQANAQQMLQNNLAVNQMFNGAYANNGNFFNQPASAPMVGMMDPNEQPAFGARIRRPKVNPQVQQYANAVAAPIPPQDTQPDPAVYARKRHEMEQIMAKKEESLVPSTELLPDDAPIVLRKDCSQKEFDPEDKSTWPIDLINRYIDIDRSNEPAAVKKYRGDIAVSEEYWKSKGIIWSFDGGLEVSRMADAKREERQLLPEVSVQYTDLKDYKVTVKGDDLLSGEVETTKIITEVQNNTVVRKIAYARINHDTVVPNFVSFIDMLTDGRLRDMYFTKQGATTVKMDEEDMSLGLSVSFETAQGIDIPFNMMELYYKSLQSICLKYTHDYMDKFEEFMDEMYDLLYDMPRRFSERLEKFIIKHLDDAISRHIISFEDGVPRPPHVKQWKDLYTLLKPHKKYNYAYSEQYVQMLQAVIFQLMYALFSGSLLDPTTETDLNVIVDGIEVQDFIKYYHGDTLNTSDVEEWRNEGEDGTKKLEKLQADLKKFAVITVERSILITDVAPKYRGDADGNELCFNLADNHLSRFDIMILNEFDYGGAVKDAVIVDNNYHWLKKPTAYFRLYKTLDNYIGYSLI